MTNIKNQEALGLLKAYQEKKSFKTNLPSREFLEVLKTAKKYAKNNPIMYVLDFSKAKIIETTQAEYDLSLVEQKQFSLPVFEKQEIINKFFAILKNGIKITLKNENTQLA